MDPGKKVTCLNCGKTFPADYSYCPYCGQANKKHDLSFKYVVSEFLSANFNLDAKIFVTLKLLLFSPGKLSRDYLDGKRMRYISPVRLYLFVSLIYFFLLSIVPNATESKEVRAAGKHKTEEPVSVITEIDHPTEKADSLNDLEKMIIAKTEAVKSEEGKRIFREKMRKNMSTGMLVMLPFTALLLYLLFYRNSYYFEHLIFVIHLQTVWFIISAVYMLVHLIFPWNVLFYIEVVLVVTVTFLWFKRFYRLSTGKTLWKLFLFFPAFVLLIALFFVVVMLVSLLW